MTYPHLTVNTRGVLCIAGTRHRVIDIVADHVAHGYSAAQIVEQYPDLTPAQVHAALTYYYDHEDELNATLMASYTRAEHQRHQHQPHPKLVAARGKRTNAPTLHGRARQNRHYRNRAARVGGGPRPHIP